MIGHNDLEVERKIISILKIINESSQPVGARLIARQLKGHGVELGERAVRYHLKLMDERGLTRLIGRDGRLITEAGIEELKSALVRDKVGLSISRIEMLSFRTDFDLDKHTGWIPANISFFPRDKFSKALKEMRPAFSAGFCASDLVAVAGEGETLGELTVPEGKTALATVCSLVINGTLLKAGVPIDSRFGGILQIRNHQPIRFVELIHYAGSSLDPSEVFISAKMTSVGQATRGGSGKILANFREIPALCRPVADEVVARLKEARLNGVLVIGETSEAVCEVPIELNRIGMVLLGGLNPVAAVAEAGIEVESQAMGTVLDYQNLIKFEELI
jgi:repressor of nif and glnA expression